MAIMRAIQHEEGCSATELHIGEVPRPEPGSGEILVAVEAAGLNRADILQRKGHYPPPPGASPILGLELAGRVAALGPGVEDWSLGDRVFGLVSGGACATHCLIPAEQAMAIPDEWDDSFAAAIPEVFFTADETLFEKGGLEPGTRVLIHAGGSGVGSTAIQMAAVTGARIFTTAGSPEKLKRASALGAELAIDYKTEDFAERILEHTDGAGVALILDFIGAAYLKRHLRILGERGSMVVIGLLGGVRAELDLGAVLSKELRIVGAVLRSRPTAEKARMKTRFLDRWMGPLLRKEVAPVIHAEIPWTRIGEAHRLMEENGHFGKIVLRIQD